MTDLPPELQVVGQELTAAYALLLERRRRRLRALRMVAAGVGVFCAFTAAALASSIGKDLYLDPTKWEIFDRGTVDGGKAAYIKAHSRSGDGDSTFIVEHDAALGRYDAFVLHENAVTATRSSNERGTFCTPGQLTRAETIALTALRSAFAPGTSADVTKGLADDAVRKAFDVAPCRGLDYASERARFVHAGIEPRSMLMPGAR